MDVLSLIPTHFDSQQDLLNASRVCRYWRKTFLQHAVLWSRLDLSKGEACVRTFLERAKGTALDVITHRKDRVTTMSLLSPHTQQIRSLHVVRNLWTDVQTLFNINSGPLPFLRTLEISVLKDVQATNRANLSLPLFSGAANLKQLILSSSGSPPLSLFAFPNLTTFKLHTSYARGRFHASELFSFLEASPTLRTVDMVLSDTSLDDIAQRKAVVLPNVQTLSLTVEDCLAYEFIAHISCPSVTRTSLIHMKPLYPADTIQDIQDLFPTAALWNTIVRQYTRSPVEAVAFYTGTYTEPAMSCTLTFRSSDTTVISLSFEISYAIMISSAEERSGLLWEEVVSEIFSEGPRVVRDHPLLSDIKHLHILNATPVLEETRVRYMADEVGELFQSMGPLEGLTLHGCDLHSYLTPFLTDLPDFEEMEQSITYPPIKNLTVLHPSIDCMGAIAKLAKSQHTLGVPFDCVTVRAEELPAGMAEGLKPWVGVVDCCKERYACPSPECLVSSAV